MEEGIKKERVKETRKEGRTGTRGTGNKERRQDMT